MSDGCRVRGGGGRNRTFWSRGHGTSSGSMRYHNHRRSAAFVHHNHRAGDQPDGSHREPLFDIPRYPLRRTGMGTNAVAGPDTGITQGGAGVLFNWNEDRPCAGRLGVLRIGGSGRRDIGGRYTTRAKLDLGPKLAELPIHLR